jgi:uncharacterized membrane protein YedE/YeeE
LAGLAGGTILGVSTSFFLYATGNLTGISGLAEGTIFELTVLLHHLRSGSIDDHDVEILLRNTSYIAGLAAAGVVLSIYRRESFGNTEQIQVLSTAATVVAGMLVGSGTRLAKGCTSGHGLCGLSRLSPRSALAVATFMATGAAAAFFKRTNPSLFFESAQSSSSAVSWVPLVASVVGSIVVLYATDRHHKSESSKKKKQKKISAISGAAIFKKSATSLLSALVFGLGLGVGGMTSTSKVIGFLDFAAPVGWDLSLMMVMASGLLVNGVAFHYMAAAQTPLMLCEKPAKSKVGDSLSLGIGHANNTTIDWRLVVGSVLFGAGWGIAGVCPGPGLVTLGAAATGALSAAATASVVT